MILVLLTLAFLLELVAFGSFAAVGFLIPIAKPWQIIASIGLFILLIGFWALYMSPKAPKKYTPVKYYMAKTLIYALSTYVLFMKTNFGYGIVFVLLAVVDELLLYKHNLKN